jgi:two-component system, NarL family, nitrate/nitrite response regulator NarL
MVSWDGAGYSRRRPPAWQPLAVKGGMAPRPTRQRSAPRDHGGGGVVGWEVNLEIVLGDDHVVFLDALTQVLAHLGHQIVAAVSTRAALLESVRACRPSLCITESSFPDGDAIDAIREIANISPATKVIVLTADLEPGPVRRALTAGAVGYLHKSRGLPAVIEALRRVRSGEVVVEGAFSSPRATEPQELQLLASYLTPREFQCLELLAAGLGTSVIATRLGVSTTTTRSHVQAVLTKLGVHSRLEAASVAIRFGLVSPARDCEERRAQRSECSCGAGLVCALPGH